MICKRWLKPTMLAWVLLVGLFTTAISHAQTPLQLPTPEYYTTYNLLGDGRTLQANPAFRTLLRPLNVEPDRRSIEAIPTLVMLGECYYQEGNTGLALEQWEAALAIGVSNANWLSHLDGHLPLNEKNDPTLKGIDWWTSPRKPKLLAAAHHWPVVLGGNSIQIKNPGGGTLQAGLTIHLDALEILRSQAWAIRRRRQILGSLESVTLSTDIVRGSLKGNLANLNPILHQGRELCRIASHLSIAKEETTTQELLKLITLPSGTYSYLTPMVLLLRGDFALEHQEWQAAKENYLEASIIAAAYQQYEVVAEATTQLANLTSQEDPKELLPRFQKIANWSQSRSRMIYAAALNGQAESLIAQSEWGTLPSVLDNLTKAVAPADVKLIRLEANGFRLASLASLAQGKRVNAAEQRAKALQFYEADDESGIASIPSFRLNLAWDWIRKGIWQPEMAMDWIPKLIDNPSAGDWREDPLGCIAFLHGDKSEQLQYWLGAEIRRNDSLRLAYAVDVTQRHAFYRSESEGGRLTSLRRLLCKDRLSLKETYQADAQVWQQRLATLAAPLRQMEELSNKIRLHPIQLDNRQWTESQRGQWGEWTNLLQQVETAVLSSSLTRHSVRNNFPEPLALDAAAVTPVLDTMPDGTCLLSFFVQENSYFGLLLSHGRALNWRIGSVSEVNSKLETLLDSLGVLSGKGIAWDKIADANWRVPANELAKMLVPTGPAEIMATSDRCCLVPHGALWLAPFELLSLPNANETLPWLGRRRLAYYPTLGQAMQAPQARPTANRTLAIVRRGFFSEEDKVDRKEEEGWKAVLPETTLFSVQASSSKWQASRYARLQADRVWIAGRLPMQEFPTFAPFGYDALLDDGKLSSWLLLPFASPKEMILPGFDMMINGEGLERGQNLFELACVLQATGNQSTLISRWPIAGSQVGPLFQTYLSSLPDESGSAAWQRAVTAFWEETSASSSSGKTKSSLPTLHKNVDIPWLWSGYMQIGDTLPQVP